MENVKICSAISRKQWNFFDPKIFIEIVFTITFITIGTSTKKKMALNFIEISWIIESFLTQILTKNYEIATNYRVIKPQINKFKHLHIWIGRHFVGFCKL